MAERAALDHLPDSKGLKLRHLIVSTTALISSNGINRIQSLVVSRWSLADGMGAKTICLARLAEMASLEKTKHLARNLDGQLGRLPWPTWPPSCCMRTDFTTEATESRGRGGKAYQS